MWFGNFRNYFKFVKESGERDEGPPCGWAWPPIGQGARDITAESVLRITPAAREQGPRDQCKNPEG